MASSMQYYTITITNSITNSAPSDGFIDNKKIEQYYAATPNAFETTPANLTFALTQAKRRANVRYQEIIRQLELVQNVWIDPNSITVNGASPTAEPTSISFQIVAYDWAFTTLDELNNNASSLTSTDCIQRCVARALTAPGNTMYRQIDILDPTSTTTLGSTTQAPRVGSRINVASDFEIGPYASSIANANAVIAVAILNP